MVSGVIRLLTATILGGEARLAWGCVRELGPGIGDTCAVPTDPDPQTAAIRLLDEVVAEHSNAEDRPQQHEMTRLVADAVATGEPLIVQAGTGTGKSLAYLCGAVGAGASVVVSTATRQLSDQLLNSDVPFGR